MPHRLMEKRGPRLCSASLRAAQRPGHESDSPLIATALLAWAGSYWAVSVYIIALSIITIISTLMAPETARDALKF